MCHMTTSPWGASAATARDQTASCASAAIRKPVARLTSSSSATSQCNTTVGASVRRRCGGSAAPSGAAFNSRPPSTMLHLVVACHAMRSLEGAVEAGARALPGRSLGSAEQLHDLEWRGRPRSEAIERERRPLAGLDVHEQVVIFLLGRLALPIEIRRIVRRNLDARPAGKNRVLFGTAAAEQ